MFKSIRKKSLANEAFGLEVALQRNDYDQVVFFLNTVEDPIPEHSMVSLFQYCIRNAYNDLFFAQIPKFQEKIETLDLVSEFVRMAIDHQNTDVFKFFVENTNIEDTNGCLLCAAVEAANTDMVQPAQKQKDLINQELSEINDSACERKRKM